MVNKNKFIYIYINLFQRCMYKIVYKYLKYITNKRNLFYKTFTFLIVNNERYRTESRVLMVMTIMITIDPLIGGFKCLPER